MTDAILYTVQEKGTRYLYPFHSHNTERKEIITLLAVGEENAETMLAETRTNFPDKELELVTVTLINRR